MVLIKGRVGMHESPYVLAFIYFLLYTTFIFGIGFLLGLKTGEKILKD